MAESHDQLSTKFPWTFGAFSDQESLNPGPYSCEIGFYWPRWLIGRWSMIARRSNGWCAVPGRTFAVDRLDAFVGLRFRQPSPFAVASSSLLATHNGYELATHFSHEGLAEFA